MGAVTSTLAPPPTLPPKPLKDIWAGLSGGPKTISLHAKPPGQGEPGNDKPHNLNTRGESSAKQGTQSQKKGKKRMAGPKEGKSWKLTSKPGKGNPPGKPSLQPGKQKNPPGNLGQDTGPPGDALERKQGDGDNQNPSSKEDSARGSEGGGDQQDDSANSLF